MLDAEEARARLESICNLDWRGDAEARIAKLTPKRLQQVARAFLEADPLYGSDEWEAFQRRVEDAAIQLDSLDFGDRATVMTALHPGLGPTFAAWWVAARSRPYQQGWMRRGFRAPHDWTITRASRTQELRRAVEWFGPYPAHADAAWLAAWAPHLGHEFGALRVAVTPSTVGAMLAAVIDAGGTTGDAVFSTLLEVGAGEHPIGVMGQHVIAGLLGANRVEGWDFIERLLLAAQRQEGLRQSILEAADEAHPTAFDRLIDLVVEHNFVRFAATIRAVGVWLGLPYDVEMSDTVKGHVEAFQRLRTDAAARERALDAGDPAETYLALFALAQHDVIEALDAAGRSRQRVDDAGVRALTAHFLAATGLDQVRPLLVEMLADDDLMVAAAAHDCLKALNLSGLPPSAFAAMESLVRRLPGRGYTSEPLPVIGRPATLSAADVLFSMLWAIGDRPLSALTPWIPQMSQHGRQRFAFVAGAAGGFSDDVRDTLIQLVGDRSISVRAAAVRALQTVQLDGVDPMPLEALLSRKASDVRQGVIGLLARLPVPDAVAAAERLWATGKEAQRDAACDLLGALASRPDAARQAAAVFAEAGLSERQAELLGDLIGTPVVEGRDDPGLGLYDPSRRAPIPAPKAAKKRRRFGSDAALRILSELDDLAAAHRDVEVRVHTWQGTRDLLLADAQYLPSPFDLAVGAPLGNRAAATSDDGGEPETDDGRGLVLGELFRSWWAERPADCRGGDDGIDALRALTALRVVGGHHSRPGHQVHRQAVPEWWTDCVVGLVGSPPAPLRHGPLVDHVLVWLLVDHAGSPVIDESLDAIEATYARAARDGQGDLRMEGDAPSYLWSPDWRDLIRAHPWVVALQGLFNLDVDRFTPDQVGRWYRLCRWLDEPAPAAVRRPADRRLVLMAHERGAATDDDVLDILLQHSWPVGSTLKDFTRRRRQALAAAHPVAVGLADAVRDRVLQIELSRGDLETPATAHAFRLGSISGAAVTVDLLRRLGRATLVRQAGGTGRDGVYSYLLRVSYPDPDDTGATLRSAAEQSGVRAERLVELAMFAPQWAALVEGALGWPGLEDAIWWFHAHTKDAKWRIDAELRETWAALSAERTPLSADDLLGGAVDVEWFGRAHDALGAERWQQLQAVARLSSGGNGHTRAQLFADAMLGRVDESKLADRIKAKRHQDSVRALGLLPLPAAATNGPREAVLRDRYAVLMEFERGAAKFGSLRQASERTAARIGVENLARTAGWFDPQQFMWAMEAAEASDLADGPVVVNDGDVTVTLSVDAEGTAQIDVDRNGRTLKAIPATTRKVPAVTEMVQRKTALTRQSRRVRLALEAAMVDQLPFTRTDLDLLDRHPVVAPMLALAIFVAPSGQTARRIQGNAAWVDGYGERVRRFSGALRLAHTVDLLESGDWIAWQEQLFADERRQPFKQAFRELYVATPEERAGGPGTHRYEGHQVQPRQALALLGRRGWLASYEGGEVSRVFHKHGLVARLTAQNGMFTAAEVELPTLDAVYFTRPGETVAMPLESVPPVVFSEAMRDLDLVVSVAHAGGVDPEATASTVEMRTALVRETARMLKLDNVTLIGPHAVIEGTLGEYSIHLGSGTVHRRPGGALCIIPVDRQRRGRVFLPFADDDPKTAEIVAKVLLLARDAEIRDPTILRQLRS